MVLLCKMLHTALLHPVIASCILIKQGLTMLDFKGLMIILSVVKLCHLLVGHPCCRWGAFTALQSATCSPPGWRILVMGWDKGGPGVLGRIAGWPQVASRDATGIAPQTWWDNISKSDRGPTFQRRWKMQMGHAVISRSSRNRIIQKQDYSALPRILMWHGKKRCVHGEVGSEQKEL